MPRGPRLDIPGALHHVMVRGIEGSPIVNDDGDRADFVDRLARLSAASGLSVFAWALMTNHAHLLVKSGAQGLSAFMRKLLTGYAISYNKRHKRHGYLFQNRFKSIVCQEDQYFLQLVVYIHLNPLRAGLVRTLDELDHYPWCGHSALMQHHTNEWQRCVDVYRLFSDNEVAGRQGYRDILAEQSLLGRRPDLTGGKLVRSKGRWAEVESVRGKSDVPESRTTDSRLLGNSDFIRDLLRQSDERTKIRLAVHERKAVAEREIIEQCQQRSIPLEILLSGVKSRNVAELRKMLAVRMVKELGLSLAETARMLGLSTPGVAQIFRRMSK